jgi:hypothetical protein
VKYLPTIISLGCREANKITLTFSLQSSHSLHSDNQFSEEYIEATCFRFRYNIQAQSMITTTPWSHENYWNRKNNTGTM